MTQNATSELPVLRVLDEEFWLDPHAAVRAAREQGPVACTPFGSPVVLRYDDCVAALADERLINDYDALLTRNGITDGPLWDWWKLAMLNNNPPVHTRLRSMVSRAFTPRAVARAEAITRERAVALLAPYLEQGHIELVRDFCEPLPIAVVCEMIGFPRGDVAEFDRWVADLGMMFSERVTPEMRATAERAMHELGAYVAEHTAERRRSGSRVDDLFGALIESTDTGDRLSHDELVAMIVNLLFGALDTTRGSLSMFVALLVQRQDLLDTLRRDRSLLASAVEELLRLEPPVGEISRVARERVQLAGVDIEPGTFVGLSVLAANRDPERFERPDDVVLDRYRAGIAPSILSFGRGIHHCLGNALARLEVRTVLDVLLEQCSRIELASDEPPRHVPFLRVRCVQSLPLTLRASHAATARRAARTVGSQSGE
ncbi:MAG TPA: cytochrome P450 [Acidimicrobiales bacterium]